MVNKIRSYKRGTTNTIIDSTKKDIENDDNDNDKNDSSKSEEKEYVPFYKRGKDYNRERREEYVIRVNNLGRNTTDSDLRAIFEQFGYISRIYVALDKRDRSICRGFAFINFTKESDAQRAIDHVNGYGFNNLILKVDWARERTNDNNYVNDTKRILNAQRRRF